MGRLSIVVPVFNTELYLPSCINSILNQSYSDFDLIIIDDGSTDASVGICDVYANKDNRVRTIHKKNGGVSSARNVGLDNARGEWVLFVDSDDLLPYHALELLMKYAENDVDMVYGEIRKFEEEENVETIAVDQEGKRSVDDALDAFIAPKQRPGDWQRYLFNRIYRLSIIRDFGLHFHSDIFYKEDGLFVVQYLCRCSKTVVCIPDIVYLYRQTSESAMGRLTASYNPKLLTNLDSHGFIFRELKQRGVSKDVLKREEDHLFQNYDWIGSIMMRTGVFTKKNQCLLLKRVIKNAGMVKTFYRFVILRYGRKIIRKLKCDY